MASNTPQLNVPLPSGRTAFKAGRTSVIAAAVLAVGQIIEANTSTTLSAEAYLGLFAAAEYGFRWLRGALGHEPGVPQTQEQQDFVDYVGERAEHSG